MTTSMASNIKGTLFCNRSFQVSQLTHSFGINHLVRTQMFPKNYNFLPPDKHTYVSVGIKE